MVKWDYKILPVGKADEWQGMSDILKKLGQEEWELVTIIQHLHIQGTQEWIFKKPIKK